MTPTARREVGRWGTPLTGGGPTWVRVGVIVAVLVLAFVVAQTCQRSSIRLDKNRQAIIPVYYQQLYQKNGKLAVKTVGYIPGVDQTFGGTFSSKTPPPGRKFPPCVKRSLPWIGKTQIPKVTG